MRLALVSFLIVLQHAAQFQCRSVPPLPISSPTASPPDDLATMITRNREISDLLIPLLEANLEAKRHDQKHNLFKVIPFKDVQQRKISELIPLSKHKGRKTPVALILASELRSRKSKGRKIHARKDFLIQSYEKNDSSEEDHVHPIKHEIKMGNPEENEESSESHEIESKDRIKEVWIQQQKYGGKKQSISDESDENGQSEVKRDKSHDDKYQNSKDSNVDRSNLIEKMQDDKDGIFEKDEKIDFRTDQRSENYNLQFDDNTSVRNDASQSSESISNEIKSDGNLDSVNSKNSFSQSPEENNRHTFNAEENQTILQHSYEQSSSESSKDSESKNDQTKNTESIKFSREIVVIDNSDDRNELNQDTEKGGFERDEGESETNSKDSSGQYDTYEKSNESNESKEKDGENYAKEKQITESVEYTFNTEIKHDSNEKSDEFKQNDSASSKYIKIGEDQLDQEFFEDNDDVTNEDHKSDDYRNDSDYRPDDENGSLKEVYDGEENSDTSKSSSSASNYDEEYEDAFEEINSKESNESDNISRKESKTSEEFPDESIMGEHKQASDEYADSMEDDTSKINNDQYTIESQDTSNDYSMFRKKSEESIKEFTLSKETDEKYTDNSNYTDESDSSLTHSDEGHSKFDDESDEVIEIQHQGEENDCKERKELSKTLTDLHENDKHTTLQVLQFAIKLKR